jgi:hypothetical protein
VKSKTGNAARFLIFSLSAISKLPNQKIVAVATYNQLQLITNSKNPKILWLLIICAPRILVIKKYV